MVNLSENAIRIFKETPKYSFEGESIEETFTRVAKEFAPDNGDDFKYAYELLEENKWRPNTPVFLNAGTKHKVFSACYVVDLIDSMDSIYDITNVSRKIFQYGSGVGIPIGNLREKDAFIFEGENDETGVAESKSSGPITFMKLFDAVGETTKSGGRIRRAAELVSMQVSHPDIMDFIKCKEIDQTLSNMNISVSITDSFMESLEGNIPFDLVSPYKNKKKGTIDPNKIWDSLVEMSWKCADPGILFIDTINKMNGLKKISKIQCTNPCGE